MNRKLRSGLLGMVMLLPLAACGGAASNEDKLANIFTESICLAKEASDLAEKAMKGDGKDLNIEEITKKGEEAKTKMEKMMKDSFGNEDEAEKAYKGIADKDAFKKKVAEKAKAKCGAGDELANQFMSAL